MSDPAVLASDGFRQQLDQCIHCGLCLPACPTYEVFRTEMDAPRGRIALMRAAAEGRIALDGSFREHIDLCLGCRSCEPACPSGVRYGALLESAREAVEAHRPRSRSERFARWLGLRQLLPHRRRLRTLASLLRAAQVIGLTRLTGLLPARLRRAAGLLPPLRRDNLDDRRPAPALGEKRGTVALFRGCVQDAFFSGVNAATVRVLQRNGYEVRFAAAETCCGAAALHLGERELARGLARRNLDAFDPDDVDAIVTNAGGCGAMLGEYPELLADDGAAPEARRREVDDRARRFAAKVRDVNDLLAESRHPAPDGILERRVTYADSCHLRHVQGVAEAPRALLRQIGGLELIELERPDFCCGSAGVYNLVQPRAADRVLDVKMGDIQRTGADLIVTTNPGCQLQLMHGVERAGLDAEVVHLMELLDRAYGPPPAARAL